MGPGLGHRLRLGLESLPRLARPPGPRRSGGLGTLGTPAGVGAAAAAPTVVGARSSADVEPDRQCLGILEQRNLDFAIGSDSTCEPTQSTRSGLRAATLHRVKVSCGR